MMRDDFDNDKIDSLENSDINSVKPVKPISLIDIVMQHQQRMSDLHNILMSEDHDENQSSVQSVTKKYQVIGKAGQENAWQQNIVEVQILDILFDDKVCSLVYMRDLTQFVEDTKRDQ